MEMLTSERTCHNTAVESVFRREVMTVFAADANGVVHRKNWREDGAMRANGGRAMMMRDRLMIVEDTSPWMYLEEIVTMTSRHSLCDRQYPD
jgi:hypothetical protein